MAFNPNQKFQIEAEKQRQKHQRDMQMAYYMQEHPHPSSHQTHRGFISRAFSFVMTLVLSLLGLSLLLGGLGFIVIGLMSNSTEGAMIGAAMGVFIALLLAVGASFRAAAA